VRRVPPTATDVELAPLTTLQLGGPGRRLVEVADDDALIAAVTGAEEPVLLLAGGSNVVIADAGFDGLVVRIATRGVERRRLGDGRVRVTVAAGEPWEGFVASCVADGLAGVESLAGIPGSTGATPIQNVGAYGQDVAQTISGVRVLDRETGRVEALGAAECGFAYRSSRFKRRDRWVVLSVDFDLVESVQGEPVAYAELAGALDVGLGERAPLAEHREAVLALRRGKGMVVDPADPDSVSAGSFFTNPILAAPEFEALAERAGHRPPAWPEPDGRVKTSAAWLIGRAGFERGYPPDPASRVGISTKHTLALVNRGGARTAELVALAREIAGGVQAAFGVALAPEPVFVGHAW
jgi:UDP-N-acetylmuramate dehydrogenase